MLSIGGGYDEEGNMDVKAVNEFYLIGYLTKGIQELYDIQVKQNEQFLADHVAKLVSIEAQIEALQSQLTQANEKIEEQQLQLGQANSKLEEYQKIIETLAS